MNRKSGFVFFFRSHCDTGLLLFLFACVGYDCLPDSPISDYQRDKWLKQCYEFGIQKAHTKPLTPPSSLVSKYFFMPVYLAVSHEVSTN